MPRSSDGFKQITTLRQYLARVAMGRGGGRLPCSPIALLPRVGSPGPGRETGELKAISVHAALRHERDARENFSESSHQTAPGVLPQHASCVDVTPANCPRPVAWPVSVRLPDGLVHGHRDQRAAGALGQDCDASHNFIALEAAVSVIRPGPSLTQNKLAAIRQRDLRAPTVSPRRSYPAGSAYCPRTLEPNSTSGRELDAGIQARAPGALAPELQECVGTPR